MALYGVIDFHLDWDWYTEEQDYVVMYGTGNTKKQKTLFTMAYHLQCAKFTLLGTKMSDRVAKGWSK